jgi:competence protein ComEA
MKQARALFLLAALAIAPSVWRLVRPARLPLAIHATAKTAEADRLLFGEKMDLNRADAAALEIIPGIGPSLAKRIIADRSSRGPFERIEDLERVRGIGPRTVEKIRAWAEIRKSDPAAFIMPPSPLVDDPSLDEPR